MSATDIAMQRNGLIVYRQRACCPRWRIQSGTHGLLTAQRLIAYVSQLRVLGCHFPERIHALLKYVTLLTVWRDSNNPSTHRMIDRSELAALAAEVL